VKILAWYDIEWAYVERMVELTQKIAGSLSSLQYNAAQ
jgi:glyceraldehyde-3-phosphate dehydrogenase/erythrose-4-phosphate dehydrogenase